MNLLRSKEEIERDAYQAALQCMKGFMPIGTAQPGSNMHMITEAMARSMAAAVRVAIDNLYTSEEFERDLGLKE